MFQQSSPTNSGLSRRRTATTRSSRKHGLGSRTRLLVFCGILAAVVLWLAVTSPAEGGTSDLLSLVPSALSTNGSGMIPIDLSVNHLQVISQSALEIPLATEEDFLPIVSPETSVFLRFRLQATVGATSSSLKDITAYQIHAQSAHGDTVLWDSQKVMVTSMPTAIEWAGGALPPGSIVKWKVTVWDAHDNPSTSTWSKFGVGPHAWKGDWITHPTDHSSFYNEANLYRKGVNGEQCDNWKKRHPLPVMRAKVTTPKKKQVVSALFVTTGVGSFAAMLDNVPLSTSSILDPPLTDYTKRVSYRGYDVTKYFIEGGKEHVFSILLGSGWWDGRPLTCCIVSINFLPRGSLAAIAELHLTYSDGTSSVEIPTSPQHWQVRKGHLQESDLFTGDVIDLSTQQKGWNEPSGWSQATSRRLATTTTSWTQPIVYTSPITRSDWRRDLAERAGAKAKTNELKFTVAPFGKPTPLQAPPVLPIERIAPQWIKHLGDGRWLLDFGKAMSGVLRFDQGLPQPVVPKNGYPRGHFVDSKSSFITVVYGESLEMETGDINLALVAGMGERAKGHKDIAGIAGPCFPKDHGDSLLQRDAYLSNAKNFKDARQSLFTFHGFRFAEVCCTKAPPDGVFAVAYRTSFQEWGRFDSSSVLLNGAYELTRNALNSNMLGTQTDCPHREKLQYGGDLVSDSPAAMHVFDLGAFYGKIITDWTDTQWEDNGAYTETSIWQDLNDYAGIQHGAGETVWASLPPVLSVRHMQHYGDVKLVQDTFDFHVKWLKFLQKYWEEGMNFLFYSKVGKNLERYRGGQGGLGDWLALLTRDTWLTHNAFYMATARCIVYLSNKLGNDNDKGSSARTLATSIQDKLNSMYLQKNAFRFKGQDLTPGPEIALFSRIVPGKQRCAVLKDWLSVAASGSPQYASGGEEGNFFRHLNKRDKDDLIKRGLANERGAIWSRRHGMPEGILAIRYVLKALSDMGFHNVALSKAAAVGYPSFEYMMSHNATTMWETWWRSEDVFSRNHPMLGAVAEWLASAVAGVSLAPTTVGGKELLFWPRIPSAATVVKYASATQGTKRGDASIAWQFENLPNGSETSALVQVHVRVFVPPATTTTLRLPTTNMPQGATISIRRAEKMPDLQRAKKAAQATCEERRQAGKGFPYNWEYDPTRKEWSKFNNGKAIGTPCQSYLFDARVNDASWSATSETVEVSSEEKTDVVLELTPGLYDVMMDKWQLEREIPDKPGYSEYTGDLGHWCSDTSTFTWDEQDATHII